MSSEVTFEMISTEEQGRIREALTANKRITLAASNQGDGGTEWSIRLLKTGEYGLVLVDADGTKDWVARLPDITGVIYWLGSSDNPGMVWEWK